MTDTFLTSVRFVVSEDLKDLREGVDGLPGEALDWRPAGADTNSIAVLVTHVLTARGRGSAWPSGRRCRTATASPSSG